MAAFEAVPALARALDPKYYTDVSVYEREKAGLMAKTWQYAGHISQIPNNGDYFSFTIGDMSLFCIRDMEGVVRAFHNVCQHRAHQLVSGDGSCLAIVCPYHAWTYELDGSFRAGPNTKNVPGFNKDNISLTEVKVENFCGFLFVNADPDAQPMSVWFPDVEQQLREFVPNIDQLVPLEWIEIEEHCNWKVSVENYSECYHCRINHPTFSSGVVKPNTYDIRPQGYALRHTTECQNLERMTYSFDKDAPHAQDYSSWFLWPTFSFQVYPGNVLNTYLWRPQAVDQVTVWRGWYTEGGFDSEDIRRLAAQDRASTVEEDISLVESVQRGLKSPGYRPGPLVIDPKLGVNSEHSIMALHHWMREAIDV